MSWFYNITEKRKKKQESKFREKFMFIIDEIHHSNETLNSSQIELSKSILQEIQKADVEKIDFMRSKFDNIFDIGKDTAETVKEMNLRVQKNLNLVSVKLEEIADSMNELHLKSSGELKEYTDGVNKNLQEIKTLITILLTNDLIEDVKI